jgi:signal transduction histidine kinase
VLNRSSKKDIKTVPLLTYWTRFYFLVLMSCLLLLAVIAVIWIRLTVYDNRYQILEVRAEKLAEIYEDTAGQNLLPRNMNRTREIRSELFLVQIVDRAGNIQPIRKDKASNKNAAAINNLSKLNGQVLAGQKIREQFKIGNLTWLRVGVPLYQKGIITGALYISIPASGLLADLHFMHISIFLIIAIIVLAGWLVLYFLSRKLTRPLLAIAGAAQAIASGHYEPRLPQNLKERELQQLVTSFSDMAFQLKQLERMRADLLAGVSHELRTPVTSIRGMIQAVHGKVVTGPEADEFLYISLNESIRLQQMVEDLLDFSTFEAGAEPIEKEYFNLLCLLDEVICQVSILAGYEQISFDRKGLDQEVWMTGDRGRLRQVFLNLFSNSQKASATVIKIVLRVGEDNIEIDVEDNGKGIEEADREYIFERFYRGQGKKMKPRGLGLGLTVSRMLSRAHGGDLFLLRTSSEGSVFCLTLPL